MHVMEDQTSPRGYRQLGFTSQFDRNIWYDIYKILEIEELCKKSNNAEEKFQWNLFPCWLLPGADRKMNKSVVWYVEAAWASVGLISIEHTGRPDFRRIREVMDTPGLFLWGSDGPSPKSRATDVPSEGRRGFLKSQSRKLWIKPNKAWKLGNRTITGKIEGMGEID